MLPILMLEDVFAFWDLLILLDYLRKQSYILQIYTRLSLTFSNTLKGNYQKRKNPKNLWLMTKVQNRPVRRKVVPLVLALKLWHQLNLRKWVRAFTTVTTVTLCEEHSQAGNTWFLWVIQFQSHCQGVEVKTSSFHKILKTSPITFHSSHFCSWSFSIWTLFMNFHFFAGFGLLKIWTE